MLNLTQPTSNPKKPGTMTTFLAPKSIPTKPMAETSLTSCRPFPLLAPALLESVPKPPSNTLPSELLWEIQPDTVGKWVIELAIAMMLLQFQMAFFELERCETRLLSSLRCSPFWDHCNSDAMRPQLKLGSFNKLQTIPVCRFTSISCRGCQPKHEVWLGMLWDEMNSRNVQLSRYDVPSHVEA